MKQQIFQAFTVKDVVFLAILSAVATCTAAVMAVVSQIHIFGLAQLVTALQFSLFPAVALMKVRKVGSILFFAVFTGIVELFMAPVMFFSSLFTGVLIEVLAVLVFRGYQSDRAVFFASWLFIPLTLPFNFFYYVCFAGDMFDQFFGQGLRIAAVVCVLAAVAVSALGAFLGVKISTELRKAGVLKK